LPSGSDATRREHRHADGSVVVLARLGTRPWLFAELGEGDVALMRSMKTALEPRRLLNGQDLRLIVRG
jgi:hypothetical protein